MVTSVNEMTFGVCTRENCGQTRLVEAPIRPTDGNSASPSSSVYRCSNNPPPFNGFNPDLPGARATFNPSATSQNTQSSATATLARMEENSRRAPSYTNYKCESASRTTTRRQTEIDQQSTTRPYAIQPWDRTDPQTSAQAGTSESDTARFAEIDGSIVYQAHYEPVRYPDNRNPFSLDGSVWQDPPTYHDQQKE
ncbi:uncharacterized protein IL334_006352 [Kwoniella shivajii]|uniref:Uncharacterized protein n=1 Tax=Kwoniella shivajii TaxID=564305 RepID=A0ABZ1D5Q4_9TREE|nr:hypothetical protein IL334_006352 [Kwoniella shivajii]